LCAIAAAGVHITDDATEGLFGTCAEQGVFRDLVDEDILRMARADEEGGKNGE